MKITLPLRILAACCFSLLLIGPVWAAYVNESTGRTLPTGYAAGPSSDGLRVLMSQNVVLVNVTRASSVTATRALLKNDAGSTLESTTTLSGNTFIFNGTTAMSAGSHYRIELDASGGAWNGQYIGTTPAFPVAGTTLNWTNRTINGANVVTTDELTTNIFEIIVDTTASVANFTITATDFYDGSTLTNFTALINGTYYTTTNGTIVTPYYSNATVIVNITVNSTDYFNRTYENYNTTSNLAAQLFQAYVMFNATEIITGNAVAGFAVTAPNATNASTPPVLLLKAGTYNITFNKTGWYNKTQSFIIAALQNDTQTYTEVYAYALNITARNAFSNASITTFNITATSGNYTYTTTNGTANGTLYLPWTADTNINLTLSGAGFATTTEIVNVTTAGYTDVVIYAYTNNSIRMTIRDESSGALLNNTTVTINTNGETVAYSNTTSNGTFYIDDLPDGEYSIIFSATNYTTRLYTVTVANEGTQELTAYLTTSTTTTTFNLEAANGPEAGQPVEGATVTFETYVNGSYVLVESRLSDVSGTAGPFAYTPSSPYRVTITATNFVTKQFLLNPVQYATYDIFLTSTTSFVNPQDYEGISIVFTPSTYYEAAQNNFTFIIGSPNGTLTAYNYTITFPGGSVANNGSNAYGSTLTNSFNITGATITDKVHIAYCYTTVVTGERCFIRDYSIRIPYSNYTLAGKGAASGMGDLEKIGLATIATGVLTGAATFAAGPIGAVVVWLVSMGFFYKILAFNIWLLLIPAFVGFLIIAFGSRTQ